MIKLSKLQPAWLFNANRILELLGGGAGGLSTAVRVRRQDIYSTKRTLADTSADHRLLTVGHRVFVDSTVPQKNNPGDALHWRKIFGNPHAYAEYCASIGQALGSSMVINLMADITPSDLGFGPDARKHLAALVGAGRNIILLRPATKAVCCSSTVHAEWNAYLSRAAVKRCTWTLTTAFVKHDRAFNLCHKLENNVYASYRVYFDRLLARIKRNFPGAVNAAVRRAALATAIHAVATENALTSADGIAKFRRAAVDAVADNEATRIAQSQTGGSWLSQHLRAQRASHDRTGFFRAMQEQTAEAAPQSNSFSAAKARALEELLHEWNTNGVPLQFEADIKARVSNAIIRTLKLPRSAIDSDLLSGLPQSRIDKEVEALLAARAALRPEEPLSSLLTTWTNELSELVEQASVLNETKKNCTYESFRARRLKVLNWIRQRCSFAPMHIEIWGVTGSHSSTASGVPIPLWNKAPSDKGNAPQKPMSWTILPDRIIHWLDEEPAVELLQLVADPAAARLHLATDEIPALANLPAVTPKLFEPPTITIDRKLRPHFSVSTQAFMLGDGYVQAYNPALCRVTSMNRALLSRSSLVAQDPLETQSLLKSLGYSLELTPEVLNRIARARERSDHNQIPLRPVEAFEAPAFYTLGDYVAQATLTHPDGRPVWIAGKRYRIVPGWSRITTTISEEEMTTTDRALAETNQAIVREQIDVGVTHWTISSEIGPINISEHTIREEDELKTSALRYPDLAVQAMETRTSSAPIAPTRAVPSDDQGRIVVEVPQPEGISDEDFALMQSVTRQLNGEPQPTTKRAPVTIPWPEWRPFLDEMVDVFPPPVPEDAATVAQPQIEQHMKKILDRFGPKYQRAETDTSLPIAVEEQAFQIWRAEYLASESAARTADLLPV